MWWTVERAHAVSGGVWLIGLGLLFASHLWWPGILILIGITSIVEGSAHRCGWQAIHGGLWMLLFAAWAMTRFSITALFVGMGVYAIITALTSPNPFKKPHVDRSLE